MLISPKVKGKITLTLKNATLYQIFDAMSSLYNYDFVRTSYGYLVSPRQIKTEIFHLNRLDVSRSGNNEMSIAGLGLSAGAIKITGGTTKKGGAATLQSTFSDKNFWKDLNRSLKLIIAKDKGNKLVINPETGEIIVQAFPSTLAQVAHFLRETQLINNKEVLIEAKILEVTLNKQFSTGINWAYAHASYDGQKGTFDYNASTNAPFQFALSALSLQGKLTVLSSPRVTTLNNQQALIKVGSEKYFVTDVTTNTTPVGTTAQESASVEIEPFFSGIALNVLPEVGNDGYINMHVHPIVGQVTDGQITISGLPGSSGNLVLPTAQGTVREADEVVRARSGQIIIIGGLMESRGNASGQTVPGLGAVSIYPNRTDTADVTELVILLRATVIKNGTWIDAIENSQNQMRYVNQLSKLQPGFVTP